MKVTYLLQLVGRGDQLCVRVLNPHTTHPICFSPLFVNTMIKPKNKLLNNTLVYFSLKE